MKTLFTTLGQVSLEGINYFLPHEHVFMDLRTLDENPSYPNDIKHVIQVISPFLRSAKDAG
jgi:phosphotriesterase-related protein